MLKFGEYARTNKGDIFIYANVVDENGNKLDYIMKLVNGGPIKYYLNKDENIVKHSKNIIDLIEVGDIVFIEDFPGYDFIYINDKEMLEALKQDVKDGVRIKSILTKELYQSNCYTVERKEEC